MYTKYFKVFIMRCHTLHDVLCNIMVSLAERVALATKINISSARV